MRPDGRLAVPAAVGWAVLAVILGTPDALPWFAGGCWLVAVFLVVVAARMPKDRRSILGAVALCGVVAALMLTSAAVASAGRWPQPLTDALESGAVVRGTAVTTQSVNSDDRHFAATLTGGTVAGQEFESAVPVLVFGRVDERTGIGAEVALVGSLGEADSAGTVAYLLFLDDTASVVKDPPWLLAASGALRDGFREVATSLPGDGGDLLPGLAIGDTGAVTSTLDSAMKVSSLSHLTAVSGDTRSNTGGLW